MNQKIIHQHQKEADFFKSLSHPIRLFILQTIKDEEYSVSELAEEVGIDISTMSKHLDVLKRQHIISGEKVKNSIYYKLNMPCVFTFLECAKKIKNTHSDCKNVFATTTASY